MLLKLMSNDNARQDGSMVFLHPQRLSSTALRARCVKQVLNPILPH